MSKQTYPTHLCDDNGDGCIQYAVDYMYEGFDIESTKMQHDEDLCMSLIKCDHCRDTIDRCVVAGTDKCVCDSRETLAVRRAIDLYKIDVETVDAIVADEIFFDLFEIDFIFSQVVHVVEINLQPNTPHILGTNKRVVTISQRVEELKRKGK